MEFIILTECIYAFKWEEIWFKNLKQNCDLNFQFKKQTL